MNRAVYPILSGALAQERQMQVFANNMANVNTAGFKQDDQAFTSVLAQAQMSGAALAHQAGVGQQIGVRPAGSAERVFVAPHAMHTSFEAGRIRITGNPLDMAITGRGFFEVKTPQGLRYTRNGMLSLDGQGRLVTNLGYPVMGIKGEIKVPSGSVQVTKEGAVHVDGKPVATIKVVEFPDDLMPKKNIEGFLAADNGKVMKNPDIQSGHIEESNVNSIGEMVKMIQGMRNYESSQKLIQTLDRMSEIAIQDVGRVL
ncbi:MAG: flagellar basal-body rod protein FlgF [Nitrospira sp.]|nr:flagellar basal-body rod protein FlgF [Nitrospira sp.]